jgi:hypothetical protein
MHPVDLFTDEFYARLSALTPQEKSELAQALSELQVEVDGRTIGLVDALMIGVRKAMRNPNLTKAERDYAFSVAKKHMRRTAPPFEVHEFDLRPKEKQQ